MTMQYRGRSLLRFEDQRFLVGRGRYVEDCNRAGQLHAYVVRSPHSHAKILGIDTAAAAAMPGVLGVFTEANLAADGLGPLPCNAVVKTVAPIIVPPRHALARGRVRHVGDPVAFVVAESRDAARDAAEQVMVDYEPLPAVVDADAAMREGAPQVWETAPGNVSYRFQKGDQAAVAAAFAAAAHTVEIELVNNRVVIAPVETRAAIGSHDAATGRFDLLLTGQGVHGIRDHLADSVFRVPRDRIRLVAPDVGGGFGPKNFLYPEYVMLLWAARRLGRPVKWVGERAEDFLSTTQGRDNITRARLAFDAAGKTLALDVATIANLGAYVSAAAPGCSTNAPSAAMGGLYAIPAIFMDVHGVLTNTVPIDAYRGAGKPEANYIIERLMDLAARQLGRDPAELRRQNFITDFPYRKPLGSVMDCGDFSANVDAVLAAADREGFTRRREASAQQGKLRGLGIACFLETSRGAPHEGAEVRFAGDGKVELLLGTQSNGQGHETSFPQVAADLLGLPMEAFRYIQADTQSVRAGQGHGGARSLHMGGTAMVEAINGAIAKGRAVAARLLQAGSEEVVFDAGSFRVRNTDRSVPLLEVARAAAEETEHGLDTYVWSLADAITFPNGCHVAEVEIDPETGKVALLRYVAVDDFGRLVNPMLTAGQVQGGVAQGIGQAMLEHTVYDPESGQLLSGSLMDYALPRADDLPALEIGFREVPTGNNPLGVKGSGQAGCISAPPTIMNAVMDALAPLGVRHLDMPATPDRVWRAIQAARK